MNVKNFVLGVGIFIVYLLVLNYGIEAFYPTPQYENYCSNNERYYGYSEPIKIANGVNCTASPTPQQQDMCVRDGGYIIADSYDAKGCADTFKCDFCGKEYNEAQKGHAQTVFIIAIIAGMVTLLAGYIILTMEPVGSALMASGVGAMVYGSMRNWQNLSNIWRFLLLLAALVLLIWIAIRINRNSGKKGFLAKLGLKK